MQQQSQWLHVAENILAYQAAFHIPHLTNPKLLPSSIIPFLIQTANKDDNGQDHTLCYERLDNISFYVKYIVSKTK